MRKQCTNCYNYFTYEPEHDTDGSIDETTPRCWRRFKGSLPVILASILDIVSGNIGNTLPDRTLCNKCLQQETEDDEENARDWWND